ncbi:MAG: cell division protein FtsA [Kiritimatiellae bacterium]|nr:cell division protein FtsA [Kiritimatiellia bacterium]
MSTNIYAALEIGTTRTVLAVGEGEVGGRLKVIGHTEIPSTNVRKSQILNIADATQSVKSVIQSAEEKLKGNAYSLNLCTAYLVVSGNHIDTIPFSGSTAIGGSKVSDEEINAVINASRNYPIPESRELLDVIDQDYVIDNLTGISAPKGMSGRILKLNTLHIIADKNRIEDAKTAAENARIEIEEPLLAVTSAAEVVLEEHEKKNGVLVLDLGGGSTGYSVYSDGYLVSAGVIGVGGDHITNDIAHAFQTTNAQAEALKVKEASASLSSLNDMSARVKIPSSNPLMDNRTISRRALNTVVNARVKELFKVIRDTLEERDLLVRMHSGIVLTGGGAKLNDLDEVAQQILGLNVRIGRPIHVDGLENEPESYAYAAVAGALLYAHRNADDSNFFSSFFGRIFK